MTPNVLVLFSFILIVLCVQCHASLLFFSDDQKAYPFEFIRTLQGSQKGAKVKGLNELKKYLQHFGYLNDFYKVQTHGQDEDTFDDILESAVKTYQVNYNLKATGILDIETVSKMMLPRCGVPDIINGQTWMRSGMVKTRQDHHDQIKQVHMVSHYEFFNGNPKWPSSNPNLTYGFVNNEGQVQFLNILSQAFNRWVNATSRFTFNRVQNPNRADIKIGVFNGRHGDGYPFDGRGGVLAHAFAPTDGRLHFDGQEVYAGGSPRRNQIHLESVAVHEIGHILGLGHSSLEAAVMYPSISPGQTKVDFNSDDLDGINALYGN